MYLARSQAVMTIVVGSGTKIYSGVLIYISLSFEFP